MQVNGFRIAARDGFSLGATLYEPDAETSRAVFTVNAATAVPQYFYRHFAAYLAGQGYAVVTYDYRGTGESRPEDLRGFEAQMQDWALLDMAGVVDWVEMSYRPQRLFHVGHSFGGQTAGLLPNGGQIDAMVTVSAQSGYWRLQGGNQKVMVALHAYLTLPVLSHIFGYMPWSKLGSGEDLPQGVALEWARWCRQPGYLLDDSSLPLARYREFAAPILAYSFEDDDWGSHRAVAAMMQAYRQVTQRHIAPAQVGLQKIGHLGYFRPAAKRLWQETVQWLEQVAPPV
jgi:predicted alpha/beta hydrolase